MADRPMQRTAASWLRDLADRLEPPAPTSLPTPTRQTAAPLVRRGGRWWYRDRLAVPPTVLDPSGAE